jgi:hypothetical protein
VRPSKRIASQFDNALSTRFLDAHRESERTVNVMGQVAGQAEGVSQSPPRKSLIYWWRREDSNLRHGAYETPALPPELRRLGRNFS